MAGTITPIGTKSPFADWTNPDDYNGGPAQINPLVESLPSGIMTAGGAPIGSNGISSDAPSVAPSTDYTSIAGAGIGAAGQAVGGIAQAAAQQAVLQQQAAQSAAGNALSEKLAKLQLDQSSDQFSKNQKLQALMWAMGANKAASGTASASRDVRRQDADLLSDVLARIYMPRH